MPDLDRAAVKQRKSQRGSYAEDTRLYPFHEYIFMNKIISNELTILSRRSDSIFLLKI